MLLVDLERGVHGLVDRTSDHQNLCRPSHRFCCDLRIGELSVLGREVCFDHPTGGRASSSNKNRYLVFDNLRNCLTEWRPANRSNVRRDNRAHQYRRISGEFYTNLVTSFVQCCAPGKREIGSSRVLGAAESD
jgi:hypothetical protein